MVDSCNNFVDLGLIIVRKFGGFVDFTEFGGTVPVAVRNLRLDQTVRHIDVVGGPEGTKVRGRLSIVAASDPPFQHPLGVGMVGHHVDNSVNRSHVPLYSTSQSFSTLV